MGFSSTVTALEEARKRSMAASALEAELFDKAVDAAKKAGMSIREAAFALGAPKSTVARHWNIEHEDSAALPGSDDPAGQES